MLDRSAIRAPLFTLVTLVASCSSTQKLQPDELDETFATSICQVLEECVGTSLLGDGGLLRLVLTTSRTTSCEAIVGASSLDFAEEEILASIEAGRIVFDGADARACFDVLATSCSLYGFSAIESLDPRCRTMLEGTVAVGGTCTIDEDCTGDARCDKPPGNVCEGTCLARVPIGGACTSGEECTRAFDGFVECDTSDANPVAHCVATTLVSNVPLGEPCGSFGGESDARTASACRPDLYCRLATADAGTCQTPLAVGVPCMPSVDVCEGTAFCVAFGGGDPTCTVVTVQTTEGASCDQTKLEVCNEADRLVCGADTLCHLVGSGELGQPCQDSSFWSFCNTGSYCDTSGAMDVCAALKPDGAVCSGDNECESLDCDLVSNEPTCAPSMCI